MGPGLPNPQKVAPGAQAPHTSLPAWHSSGTSLVSQQRGGAGRTPAVLRQDVAPCPQTQRLASECCSTRNPAR